MGREREDGGEGAGPTRRAAQNSFFLLPFKSRRPLAARRHALVHVGEKDRSAAPRVQVGGAERRMSVSSDAWGPAPPSRGRRTSGEVCGWILFLFTCHRTRTAAYTSGEQRLPNEPPSWKEKLGAQVAVGEEHALTFGGFGQRFHKVGGWRVADGQALSFFGCGFDRAQGVCMYLIYFTGSPPPSRRNISRVD